jgi:hypothetical protein
VSDEVQVSQFTVDDVLANLAVIVGQPREDRPCGGCTVCCSFYAISIPELTKPAGEMCPHCTGSGCGLYPRWPSLCRDYHCLWRTWEELGPALRPADSNVLLHVLFEPTAERYFRRLAFAVNLLGPDTSSSVELKEVIDRLVALCRLPVYRFVGYEGVLVYPDRALVSAILDPAGTPFTWLLEEAASWRARYDALLARYRTQETPPSPATA